MKKSEKRIGKVKQKSLPRTNRVAFMINDKEMNAVEFYISKYKVKNKSRFLREVLMTTVIKRLEEDSPTLFD